MKQKCDDSIPADQPREPAKPCEKCEAWPMVEHKKLKRLDPYVSESCDCGSNTIPTSDCLDELIKEQSNAIASAEKLKPLKAELEAIQAKAKVTSQEYTQEKWEELVETWKERDCCIVQLIQDQLCLLPNWKCLIDCYLCPMLHDLYAAETLLGDLSIDRPPVPTNLYDLRYWAERNRFITQRQLLQVTDVLKVWEKPVVTIEKALADNSKLVQEINKAEKGDARVLFDIFFKLIPRHLAIAPTSTVAKTGIDKKFTSFCCSFDVETSDNCCGPNVGRLSLRERLIGPMPYLIQPNGFTKMICCLSEKWYLPAMKNAASAEGLVVEVEEQIKRERTRIEKGLKDFEADAKNRLPTRSQSCCKDLEKPNAPVQNDQAPCPPKKPTTPTQVPDNPTWPKDDDNTDLL